MTTDIETRVAGALGRMAAGAVLDAVPAAPPVARVFAGARRRRQRQLARRGVAAAVLLVAATAVGARGLRSTAPAVTSDERTLERAVLASGMLQPAPGSDLSLPTSIDIYGSEQRSTLPTSDSKHIVVRSQTGWSWWTIDAHRVFDQAGTLAAQASPHTVLLGQADGHYSVSDSGLVVLSWAAGPWFVQLGAARRDSGVPRIDELAAMAARVDVTNGISYSPLPTEMVVYDGPQVQGPSVTASWGTSGSLSIAASPVVPGEPTWLVWGPGSTATARSTQVSYYGSDTAWAVIWEEPLGVRQELRSDGRPLADVLDTVNRLRRVDTESFRSLTSRPGADGITFSIDRVDGSLAEQMPPASSATTAVAALAGTESSYADRGDATDVPLGSTVSRSLVGGVGQVLHTIDDRWAGVSTFVTVNGGGCEVAPVSDASGRTTGWRAPCTGATYNADGTCADESHTCYVGLPTFAVKIENGHVFAGVDPSRDTPGVPSRLVTG